MDVLQAYNEYIGKTLEADDIVPIQENLGKGFCKTLGLVYDYISVDKVVAHLDVDKHLLQPMGLVHGGVYAGIVEDVASLAAWWWLAGRGLAVGSANSTDFIRPLREGRLTAVATPIYRGKNQQLWMVDMVRDDGERLAQGKLRLSNIPVPTQPTSLASDGGSTR